MTTFNLALQNEQEQRIKDDESACEARTKRDTAVYHLGVWDGKINFEPEAPHDQFYWQGYCEGLKQYWMKKKPSATNQEVF